MKRFIITFAAAFLGVVFAYSIPYDPWLIRPIRVIVIICLAWIGFRAM